ncbi:formate dehydrogenase accessory sulfurtransferase FdhD [Sphingorhabdus sp. YGSMI21]|uniref:formate dehydrogenase accessory sulfurtransferase FdhD n=1 Tax=Sphingorhabdus sp. YGSMI21 TaxID=2077182 RepID=UPI000C1E1A09|nr:formate dehydrogenase accessory sulfurtransferase FdhD [Sphingorhabdus sp. YGSMI21]ATW02232.1 sulfurtransferase FdhD [Sphingorhabdus sp. YGSMI21]
MDEYTAKVIRPGAAAADKEDRQVAIEAPVSIEFNGIGYAVMMATPSDLEDFVTGFAISERLVERADQLGAINVHQHEKGWIIRANVASEKADAVFERARIRVAESSCGLCGLENLELVAQPLPKVSAHQPVDKEHIFGALAALHDHQPLNKATGGVHAAAWVDETGAIVCIREDVGRHNALDKLIGAMARDSRSLSTGFVLTTSRCSYEIVEKSVIAGATTLVTISVPTSIAIERARSCGLTLISLARDDSYLDYSGG